MYSILDMRFSSNSRLNRIYTVSRNLIFSSSFNAWSIEGRLLGSWSQHSCINFTNPILQLIPIASIFSPTLQGQFLPTGHSSGKSSRWPSSTHIRITSGLAPWYGIRRVAISHKIIPNAYLC